MAKKQKKKNQEKPQTKEAQSTKRRQHPQKATNPLKQKLHIQEEGGSNPRGAPTTKTPTGDEGRRTPGRRSKKAGPGRRGRSRDPPQQAPKERGSKKKTAGTGPGQPARQKPGPPGGNHDRKKRPKPGPPELPTEEKKASTEIHGESQEEGPQKHAPQERRGRMGKRSPKPKKPASQGNHHQPRIGDRAAEDTNSNRRPPPKPPENLTNHRNLQNRQAHKKKDKQHLMKKERKTKHRKKKGYLRQDIGRCHKRTSATA